MGTNEQLFEAKENGVVVPIVCHDVLNTARDQCSTRDGLVRHSYVIEIDSSVPHLLVTLETETVQVGRFE